MERWGWPSVFWLLFVIGCILLLLVVFVMEETYRDEAVWGKGEYEGYDSDEKSEQTAVVSDKMVNPLAALVCPPLQGKRRRQDLSFITRLFCGTPLSLSVQQPQVSLLVACLRSRTCFLIYIPRSMDSTLL